MRSLPFAAGVVLASMACSSAPESAPDAGTPDASDRVEIETDGGVATFAPCDVAITGDAAFGVRLGAKVALTDRTGASRGTHDVALDVYFPDGRKPGARVVFAAPVTFPAQDVNWIEATLDAAANVEGVYVGGFAGGGRSFHVSLDGPRAAPVSYSANLAQWGTDVSDEASGVANLCPIGDVPAPALATTPATVSPITAVHFTSTVPPASDTFEVRAEANGASVPILGSVFGGRFSFGPIDALPPNADVTWTLVRAKDVLGRDFPPPATWPGVLRTAASFTAGAFTADVEGAIAALNFGAGVVDDELRLVHLYGARGRQAALVALGSITQATREIVIDWRLEGCRGRSEYMQLAVVGAQGETWDSRFVVRCDAPAGTRRVAVSGAGPVWLVVEAPGWQSQPQWLPGPPPPDLAIERAAFLGDD